MQLIELKMFCNQRKIHLRNDAIFLISLNSIDISTVEIETKYSSFMVIIRKLRKKRHWNNKSIHLIMFVLICLKIKPMELGIVQMYLKKCDNELQIVVCVLWSWMYCCFQCLWLVNYIINDHDLAKL